MTDQYGASSTSTLTIAVQGVNDSATISGNTYGSVAEDGVLSAAGVVTVSDADTGQSRFQTPASLAGVYGTFTFDASNGVWGYSLDNLAANVQALAQEERRQMLRDMLLNPLPPEQRPAQLLRSLQQYVLT